MNLLLIGNTELSTYLKNAGFKVFTCSFSKTSDFQLDKLDFQLEKVCKKCNIEVLLQVENLSAREIVVDLNKIQCLKIYYAIDIHLNYYWQKEYARNFDIFISSQKNYFKIHKSLYNQHSFWLPWGIGNYSITPSFIPFKLRKHNISFIGTIDNSRVKRKNIIDLIKSKYDIFVAGNDLNKRLEIHEVIKIYQNSKIVVNESINNEVNFRYFEATYSGALLFSEEINNGEDILFNEGKEYVNYNQDNILDKLKFLIDNPEIAENIALNGFKKTLHNHTLQHRVCKIIEIINRFNRNEKFVKPVNYIHVPLFFVILRGIGHKEYYNILKNSEQECNRNNYIKVLTRFSFEKKRDINKAVLFLFNEHLKSPENIYIANISISLLEIGEIAKAKKFLNSDNLFEGFIKLIEQLVKEKKDYIVGFINVSNIQVVLTAFDIVIFLFNKYNEKSLHSKKLNYIAAKILIKNNNYAGAINYLLNNVRYYPDHILSRKMLAKCYYKIFANELYMLEELKILLLEKEFLKFKNYLDASQNLKKEAILDIITNYKNKKLIKDIVMNLEEFIYS